MRRRATPDPEDGPTPSATEVSVPASVADLSRRLRTLPGGPPAGDRIFVHNIWFKGHNNLRHAALLPRLPRLDLYMVTCSDHRIIRGLQFRALWRASGPRHRAVFGVASRRYRYALCPGPVQALHFRGQVVVDMDDPVFSDDEVRLLGRPNVAAYVVTNEAAAAKYRSLGLDKPHHVIPQGVSFSSLDPVRTAEVAGRRRRPGDIVVGYVAAWLLATGDRGGDNFLYNTDHLFELWEEIRTRVPTARLWLVGEPSESVRTRCRGRDDIVLLGRLSSAETLAHLANVDIALYPRQREDPGRSAMKVAEYIGLGVPTVSYVLDTTRVLVETGAGIQARTPADFVEAVERLATDPGRRSEVAAAALRAGRALDWDLLAERYEREVLDVHLPRVT